MKQIATLLFFLVASVMFGQNQTTFNVDMSCADVNFTNVYVTGPWCGWCNAQPYNLMSDADGDGIYTVTVDLPNGSVEYKYMVDDWASQENLVDDMQNGGTCAPVTDYANYANRLTDAGATTNDVYGSCTACPTPSCDLLTIPFGDPTTIMPWTPVADAVLPEASQTWDPSGAMIIGGTNTTTNGRAYVYQFLTNSMNYNNSSSIDVAFDIKVINPLVGAALHLQNEFPGLGTVNNFDLQNAGINTSTWTHLSYTFNGVTAGTLFRMQFNIAAGAFVGAGGSVMIDNITVTCNGGGGVAGCTDAAAANYNPAATIDDASCLYTTTFNADMSCADVAFTNPYVTGPWCGWCGAQAYNLLTDPDGDGVYSVSVDLAAGTIEYKYMVDDWASQENLVDDMQNGGTCAPVTDYANYANRTTPAGSSTNDAYGKCGACNVTLYNVTFQVDMNQYAGTFTTPEVNGTFNGWCGNCFQMTDANGDNIWEATTQLAAGAYEYKFSHDSWTGQETLTEGSTCTITTNGFTNRTLNLTGDVVLPVVCWESCSACEYPFVGNFAFFAGGKCNLPWLVSAVVIDPATGQGVTDVIWSNGGTMDTLDVTTVAPLSGYIPTTFQTGYEVMITIADLSGAIQFQTTYPMQYIDGMYYDVTFATPMSPFYYDCGAVEELSSKLVIFPNPSNGNIQINGAFSGPYHVSVIDVNGRIVHKERFQSANAFLNVGHLADGVYQLQLSNDEKIESSTIIIKH